MAKVTCISWGDSFLGFPRELVKLLRVPEETKASLFFFENGVGISKTQRERVRERERERERGRGAREIYTCIYIHTHTHCFLNIIQISHDILGYISRLILHMICARLFGPCVVGRKFPTKTKSNMRVHAQG